MTEPSSPRASESTNRAIIRLAVPMILANISPPLIGFVDTAVVGRLGGAHYIGAVAIGAIIFSFAFTALNFLRMTTTGLAAQAAGANDGTRLRTVFAQGMGSALYLALLLLIVQQPLGRLAFELIDPSAAVLDLAWDYYAIRIWSAPATLASFVLIGWFVGLGNGRAPLAMVLVSNFVNLGLDLLFVLGFGWDVRGVAWASVIAEYCGAFAGLVIARGVIARYAGRWRRDHITDLRGLRDLFAGNANLFLRTLMLMFTFGFVTTMGARQSDAILAANAILINLQFQMAYVLDGFANAAESLTGRAIGARDSADLERSIRACLFWSLGVALAIALIYAFAGPFIVRIATNLPVVIEEFRRYLPWLVALPLVCAWPFLYDGVFVGATRARAMRDVMFIALFLVFLPVWYSTRGLGNHGLWFAFLLFNAARGLTQHLIFRRWIRTGSLMQA